MDSLERAIERRAGDEHVDPPDRGVISLSARARPLVPLLSPRYPAVAEALEGATEIEASAAADDRGLRVTTEVRFTSSDDAKLARERAHLLLGVLSRAEGPFGKLARGAIASAVGPSLVLLVELDAKQLASLFGCLEAGQDC